MVAEPEGIVVGSVDEDFAMEASGGDIFQLGNMSWRILRSGSGELRVAEAHVAADLLALEAIRAITEVEVVVAGRRVLRG